MKSNTQHNPPMVGDVFLYALADRLKLLSEQARRAAVCKGDKSSMLYDYSSDTLIVGSDLWDAIEKLTEVCQLTGRRHA